MLPFITSWGLAGFVVSVFLGFAWGALGLKTHTSFMLSKIFFSIAFIIPLARLGYWMTLWGTEDRAQLTPLALLGILIIILLWVAAIKLVKNQEKKHLVQMAARFGNLQDRALDLSRKIRVLLWRNNYPQPRRPFRRRPYRGKTIETYPKDRRGEWATRRSEDFKSLALDDVTNIRKEFAKHDYLDPFLEKFFKAQDGIKDANLGRLATGDRKIPETMILPEDIMGIAASIEKLAKRLSV